MSDYTITLTGEEIIVVGEGVSSLPFKRVASLMANIQTQINAQDAARLAEKQEIENGPPGSTE